MSDPEHWDAVYGAKAPDAVSWYAPHLEHSLAMIRTVADPPAAIIDVGAGASTLVDDLLDLGYARVTLLDVSSAALAVTRVRLGARAKNVQWIAGDVTTADLPGKAYDVWHDRTVFHFLTEPADRRAYVRVATECLKPGGHAILATFSLEGPMRCSGLDVIRYDAESLSRALGPAFAQGGVGRLSCQRRAQCARGGGLARPGGQAACTSAQPCAPPCMLPHTESRRSPPAEVTRAFPTFMMAKQSSDQRVRELAEFYGWWANQIEKFKW